MGKTSSKSFFLSALAIFRLFRLEDWSSCTTAEAGREDGREAGECTGSPTMKDREAFELVVLASDLSIKPLLS